MRFYSVLRSLVQVVMHLLLMWLPLMLVFVKSLLVIFPPATLIPLWRVSSHQPKLVGDSHVPFNSVCSFSHGVYILQVPLDVRTYSVRASLWLG